MEEEEAEQQRAGHPVTNLTGGEERQSHTVRRQREKVAEADSNRAAVSGISRCWPTSTCQLLVLRLLLHGIHH